MKPRIFHLTDFPNNVYVYLEDNFRKSLFNRAIKLCGSWKELCNKIEVPISTFGGWYLGKRKKGTEITSISIRLGSLKNLLTITDFYDLNKLDKYVTFIRSEGKKIIENPKLPLKETTTLFSLIGNLLGDGYGSSDKETPNYTNRNEKLLMEFKRKLKIFGDVPTSFSSTGFYVRFPKVIVDILKHLYKLNLGTFNAGLPKILWKLPRRFIASSIGAIIDDDGTICDDKIEIYSSSKRLLEDVLGLLHKRFPEIKTGKIIPKRKNYFFFQIYTRSFKYVKNFIPILHTDKIENLEFNLKRQKLRPFSVTLGKGVTKSKIIDLLSKMDLTTKEISRTLLIGRSTINEHLNHLAKEGRISFIKIGGKSRSMNCRVWRLDNGIR